MESETIASATERYEKRIAFFSEQAKTFDARSRRYSNLRLAIVLLGTASVFVIPKNNAFGVGVLAGILVFLVILFAIIAFRHQAVEDVLLHARATTDLNAEGKARINSGGLGSRVCGTPSCRRLTEIGKLYRIGWRPQNWSTACSPEIWIYSVPFLFSS